MADRNVVIRLRGDISDFQAKMVAAGRSIGAATDKMTAAEKSSQKWRASLGTVADAAGKFGLVAAGGLAAVTKAAMDWETAWTGVTKTVDGTTSQMADLERGLRELAKELPATHDEIAGVAEAAGQLGIAREGILAFTRTMIDLSETTNLTADEAATSIAQMANVMQTAPDDIDNLGAALVALGNDGASTERDIIQMAQRISATGAQIGLAESDVLAFANAAASMGIEVEAGGSAISRVFSNMAKAVAQGGPKLEQFAETASMTGQQFVAAFKDDPAEAFAAFTGGLDKINKSGGDVFSLLTSLGMSDIRVSQALLSMAAAGDLLTDSLDLGAQAWEDNTALAIEAAKRYQTTAAQTQIAWNNIKDAAIDFGETTLPILAGAADKVAGFASALGDLPGPVKTAATALGGVTAVLGGGLWFGSKALTGVSNMRTALTDLGVSADKTSKAMKGVGIAAGVMVGLAAAGAGITALQESIDETLPGLETLTRRIIGLASVTEGFSAVGLGREFDDLGDSIERIIDAPFTDKLQSATDFITPWDNTAKSLREARGEVDALDSALANLVATGNADVASRALDNLVATGAISRAQLGALVDLLPQYEDALAGQANAADLAAGATDNLTGVTDQNTDGVVDNTDAILENVKAMQKKRDDAIRAADAEINYAAAVDDANAAAKENGRTVDIATEKGRANREALLGLAQAWNDQSDAAQNTKGAFRDAIGTFADVAVRMGMNKDAARDYARELMEIPPKRATRIELETQQAQAELDRWKAQLGTGLNMTVRVKPSIDPSLIGPGGFATGGFTGNVPVNAVAGVVHGREFVHDADLTSRFRPLFEYLHRYRRMPPGYQQGGFVQQRQTQVVNNYGHGMEIDYDRLTAAMLKARPLYGDVHNHGDGSFRRELRKDSVATAGGKVIF